MEACTAASSRRWPRSARTSSLASAASTWSASRTTRASSAPCERAPGCERSQRPSRAEGRPRSGRPASSTKRIASSLRDGSDSYAWLPISPWPASRSREPCTQAASPGRVAEDDLVDQSLDRREIVGEDLVVVRRDAQLAVVEDALGHGLRQGLVEQPQVVLDGSDRCGLGRPINERVTELRNVDEKDAWIHRGHRARDRVDEPVVGRCAARVDHRNSSGPEVVAHLAEEL